MEALWFYAVGGQRLGPVPLEQLVAALFSVPEPRKVLVWREGMADWMAAGSVPEVGVRLPPPQLPPLPYGQAVRPTYLKDAETMARLYRRLVLLVGFQILLGILQAPLQAALSQQGALLAGVILVALLCLLVAIAVTAYKLSDHLGESVPLLWAIAMFLPCINIIVLLILSSKAQTWCARYGLKVGFFGPTPESIEELRQRMSTSHFE